MADQQVERLVDDALKHSNFKVLDEFLLDENREGKTKCSKQFISKLDKLIIRELDNRNLKNASLVFTILHKMGNTFVFPGGDGISAMVSQGLVKKWFGKVRKFWTEAGPARNEMMINLSEDFFDAIMVVHESCKEGTYQVTEYLLHHIGKLASDAQVNILIQKEAVRKLNVILGKIPVKLKKENKILSSQEASTVMDELANRILEGGDYDLQVGLMEALCRMTSHAQRRELADRWFSMELVASEFSKIQDSKFETDCRKFLNLVNGMQGDGRRVYSYPCLEVFLDKHELLMPVDENLNEFWIDFNLGSQSISFYFCLPEDQAQQEGQWDTLCIAENEIHSYTVEGKKDVKMLQLLLSEPVCVSNIEGSRLTIHFSSSLDILHATKKVYGEAKNKKFFGKTTTSVVKTTVQIILDEGSSQVLFPESQTSSVLLEKTLPASVRDSTPFHSFLHHEKYSKHHRDQTITPMRSKVSESCMYVSGSAGRKLSRSPFSCVMPAATPVGKAKLKPALEMVASSERKKENELKELLLARSSCSMPSVSEHKDNLKKQRSDVPQEKKDCNDDKKKYRRHIPVDKVLEMVQAEPEPEELPLDNSMVPDSQPTLSKDASILPGLSHIDKDKKMSVSGSLLSCQKGSSQSKSGIIAPVLLSTELTQRPSSAQRGSGALTHKQLHAQLTQRLEQVLKKQEQKDDFSAEVQKRNALVAQHPSKCTGAGKRPGSQRTTPAKSTQSGRAKMTKAAENVVKHISSHYKGTDFIKSAPEMASQFNIAPSNRYPFNLSWYPASASCNQSKKPSDPLNRDVFEFTVDKTELTGKKNRKSSEISGMESSNSLTLSNSAKKCLLAKPTGRDVKKHLFSDTDIDSMTEVSWIKSANRRPKPKVADYTRQPVKPAPPPADTTFETPDIPLPSLRTTKALPLQKKKRQKKVDQNNKKSKNMACRKPTGRPKRTAAQAQSYKELSDSESQSQTDEPPPAKKLIFKKTEKSQRRDVVQAKGQPEMKDNTLSEAAFKLTVKENRQANASYKVMKERPEREISIHEPSKKTEMSEKELWASKTGSSFPPSTKKIRSEKNSAALHRSPFVLWGPPSKKILQPDEPTTDTDNKFMEKKEVVKLHCPRLSKSKKTPGPQELSKEQRESAKRTSICPSPCSIEVLRSAEKLANLTRSPITPLRLPSISPVSSPPMELPGHLKGIQASSFYKTSVGQYRVKLSLSPVINALTKKQSAAEVQLQHDELSPMPSMAQPLITSTGREALAAFSPLNSPDLEENLRGFLNSASQGDLHASFDKESVISLVTLSQSSHQSVNSIAMVCTKLEKSLESVQGSKTEKAEFQSGPSTHRKRPSSCTFNSMSEDSEEEEGKTQVRPSDMAVKMKPRKLFKPIDKPWLKIKASAELCNSEEEDIMRLEKRRGPAGVTKKSPLTPQSRSPSATVEDVEMHSTVLSNVVSSCWETSLEADIDLPQSEISTSQEMGYVCHQFSTELKRKFENRSRKMDLFAKQSIKAFRQHVSSISVQMHKYRTQRLEKVKQVLMDEIKNLEQDDTALHNMEEELTSYWKKQTLSFHTYQERGARRLDHLKSAIETNVLHSLEYEDQIFSSEMCLMKKDTKCVQDRILRQMQEEELLNVRRGLQTLFLPDVPMF